MRKGREGRGRITSAGVNDGLEIGILVSRKIISVPRYSLTYCVGNLDRPAYFIRANIYPLLPSSKLIIISLFSET